MSKSQRRGVGAALLLAAVLAVGIGAATPAFASEPAVVHGGTTITVNPDGTFTATVTIKNSGAPGAVSVSVRPCANVGGLTVTPSSLVLDRRESAVVTITGTLTDPSKPGCFHVGLRWVTDKPGWFDDGFRTSWSTVNVNSAPRAGGGQQGAAPHVIATPDSKR
jgi:hypothetical protein